MLERISAFFLVTPPFQNELLFPLLETDIFLLVSIDRFHFFLILPVELVLILFLVSEDAFLPIIHLPYPLSKAIDFCFSL